MSALQEFASTITAVAETAGPSTVGIGSPWSHGSGIVVKPGLVLTNAHNLRDRREGRHGSTETSLDVTFAGGRSALASVRAADVDGDLAVLAVDTADLEPLAWSDTEPSLGMGVVALANPGGRGLRATLGLVSALSREFRGPRGRRIAGSIEHTAPLARGSSGGPLLDASGRLLGINTNRLGQGFYLAIPANAALAARVDALAAGTVPTRRRLGVALVPSEVAARLRAAVGLPERAGLLVRGVEPEGPSAAAGLAVGDLIVSAGGAPVARVDDLYGALDALPAEGPALQLVVVRGAEELSITVSNF